MVSVRFSGMFNMVQEFGTAVYRIAANSIMHNFQVLVTTFNELGVYVTANDLHLRK